MQLNLNEIKCNFTPFLRWKLSLAPYHQGYTWPFQYTTLLILKCYGRYPDSIEFIWKLCKSWWSVIQKRHTPCGKEQLREKSKMLLPWPWMQRTQAQVNDSLNKKSDFWARARERISMGVRSRFGAECWKHHVKSISRTKMIMADIWENSVDINSRWMQHSCFLVRNGAGYQTNSRNCPKVMVWTKSPQLLTTWTYTDLGALLLWHHKICQQHGIEHSIWWQAS